MQAGTGTMSEIDPETMEVRADEVLDTTRLLPWLRERLPGTDGPVTVRQFGGGHANLTYLLAFADAQYVLRRPPLGPVAPSAHDMQREHRVLSRLWERFPLAPRSFVLCTDPAIIGADFHVLERKEGFVLRATNPEETEGKPELCRRIGEMIPRPWAWATSAARRGSSRARWTAGRNAGRRRSTTRRPMPRT